MQALGYILAHHTPGSDVQFSFLEKAVRQLRLRGLYPLALVLDQGTTNVKMVKAAGATKNHPIIDLAGEQIAVMYDSPHLLKNTKSMLMKYNVVFGGHIASFSHIVKLFELDCDSIPRLVPRLTDKCVYAAPFRAMNVSQAARTMSESTSVGLEYLVDTGELPLSALGTASLTRFFDQLFDSFNSKSSSCSTKVITD